MDGGRVPASEPPRLPSSRLSRLRQASSPSSGNSRLNRSFDAATTHASGYDVEDLAAQREELQQLSRQLEAMLAGGSGGEIFGNQASAQEGGAADALVEQEDEEEQQEEDDEYSDDEHHEDDDEDEDEDGDDEEDDDDEEQEEEEEEEEEIGDDDSNKENENNADGDDDDEEEEQPDEEQGDADDDDEDAAFSMQELAFLPDAVVEQLPDDLRETVRDVKMQYERLAEKQQQLQELQQQLQLLQSLRGEPASGDDDVGQALMAMQGLLGLQGMTGDREDVDEEDAAAAAADDDDDDDGQGGDKNDGDQHQHQQQLFGLGREQLAQVLPMLGVDLDQMAMLQHALGMPTGDDDNDNNDENDGNDENDETNDTDEQQQQQHDGGDAATQPSLDNIEESVVAASELARTLPQSSTQRAELDRLLQELHETRRMRQQLLQLRSLQEQQQQQQQQGSGGDEEDEDAAGEGATGQEGAQSGGAPVRSNANDSLNLNRAQQHRRGQPQQQGGDDGDEEETVDDVVESRRVAEARRELEAKRARLAELQAFRDRLIQEEQQLQQNSAAQEQYRELQEQQQQLADLRTQLAALKEQRAALLEQKRQRMLAAQQQQDEAESDGEDEAEEDGAQQQRQRRQQQQEGVDDGDEEEEEEDEEEDEVTEESREALAQQLSQELQRHQQLLAMLRAQKEGLRALRFGQAEQGTGEDEDEDERDEDEEDEQGSASAGGSGINSRIDALLGRVEQLRAMGHGVIREAQELRQRRQRSAAYHDGIEEVPEEEEDADDDDDEDVQQQQQEQQRQRRQRRGLMGMEIGPREDELSGLRQAEIDEVLRNLDHEKGYLLPGRISPRSGSVSLAPALGATTEPSVAAEMSTTMAGEGEGDDDGADAQADAAEWQLEQDIMMDELDELHRLEEQYRNTIEAAMEQGDQNADFVIRQRGLMDNLNRMRERVLLLRQQLGEQRTRGSADAEYWQDDEEDDDDYNTARDAMARAVSGAEYRQHQRELQQRGGMYGREGLSDVYERIAEYNDDMRMDGSGGGGVDDDDDVVEDEEEDHRMDQVSNAAYAQTREDIEIRRSEEAHNFQMALAYASILEPTERHEFLSLFFSRLMEGPFGAFVEAAQSYSLILANLDVRSDGEVHTAVSRAARRHHQQHQQQQQHQYQAPAQAWPNMWSGYPAMSPARMGLHTPAGGRGLEASNAGTVPSTAAAKPNDEVDVAMEELRRSQEGNTPFLLRSLRLLSAMTTDYTRQRCLYLLADAATILTDDSSAVAAQGPGGSRRRFAGLRVRSSLHDDVGGLPGHDQTATPDDRDRERDRDRVTREDTRSGHEGRVGVLNDSNPWRYTARHWPAAEHNHRPGYYHDDDDSDGDDDDDDDDLTPTFDADDIWTSIVDQQWQRGTVTANAAAADFDQHGYGQHSMYSDADSTQGRYKGDYDEVFAAQSATSVETPSEADTEHLLRMVGQCIQGGIVSDSNLDDDDDDDDDGDDRAAYELAYVHGGDEGEYGAAAADHGSGGGDDAAGLAWRRRRLGGGVEVELGRAALLARALLSSTSQSRSSSVSSSAPVTTTATDTREQSTAEDGAGHRDGIDYDYDHENLDDDDDEEEEELNETIRHHVLGVPSQDGSKSMLERIRDTSRRLRTEEEAGTAAAANIAAGMPSKDSGDSQLESWYGSISSTSSGRGRAANRRNHDRVGRDAAAADDMTIADGRSGHGDGGGGGGGDHRAPPRQPSSDSLLQEFSDDLFVHAVILQQAEGVFDALPSNATLDSNVVNRLCLTIEECLRTTAASSTWPEACPDELESELAASVRGVMVKHLGSPVAACRARALQDIDSLLYDEMVFNKVIEQVDRSYQKEMAELRVAQAELLREETSLTKERRATMDKLSQDRQQRLQSLISASSKGDDDDDRGRDGGDVHGAPPLHYLPTLHDDDDGGRGSHGDNRGRTGADDGDEDGEEEEEADVAALHDLLFSQMLGAATAASADMGEGSHVITPDEFMTQHIQLPADGSGDDTRVHVNGRRVPQQPATDDAFVESSSSSSSSSPATAASVSPSTTAGTTTEPRPDEQGSSNARESGDGEAADADGEDADTPSDSRAEAETGEEDQEGGGDDDSEVVVVTADVEDDDFDHDMTVISARLSDAGLVSPQADGDGGDYDDEEEDGEEDEEDELVNGCQREAMAKYMFAMSELGEEESGADDTSGSPVLQQRHMNCDYRNTADDAQLHDLFAKIDAAAVEDDASAVHEAELTPDTLATPTDF